MQLVRRRKRPVDRASVSYVAVHIVGCWRTEDDLELTVAVCMAVSVRYDDA